MFFGVVVLCRILSSFVGYLYVSCSGSITSVEKERANLLVIMWFLFGEVFSSSGCLGWAALFYCGTPCAFHIIILLILKSICNIECICFANALSNQYLPHTFI